MSDLWWYAPRKNGLVEIFQLALGAPVLIILLPFALLAAFIDSRRR